MSDKVPVAPLETCSGPFVSASAPAIGRTDNEDILGTFEDHTAWVIDGADDPLADKAKCPHDATWYVRTLHQAIAQTLSEDRPLLPVLLQRAIQHVKDVHEGECTNPFHRKPSAAICIFRSGSEAIDYLVLGDASILLESSDGVVHVTDRRLHRIGQDVRYTILDRLAQGYGYDDPLRTDLLRQLVNREQNARNTATGYSIAAFDPGSAFDAVAESLPFSCSKPPIYRAALLSDGAERAMSTFGLCPNWPDFMKLVSTEGPVACINRIREAEVLDNTGKEYPRTKFSDDASITLWTGVPS
jgi:hypothetical protein